MKCRQITGIVIIVVACLQATIFFLIAILAGDTSFFIWLLQPLVLLCIGIPLTCYKNDEEHEQRRRLLNNQQIRLRQEQQNLRLLREQIGVPVYVPPAALPHPVYAPPVFHAPVHPPMHPPVAVPAVQHPVLAPVGHPIINWSLADEEQAMVHENQPIKREQKRDHFKNPQQNQSECLICGNEFIDERESFQLDITECHHHFHRKCLNKWIKKYNSCPKCFQELKHKKSQVMMQ